MPNKQSKVTVTVTPKQNKKTNRRRVRTSQKMSMVGKPSRQGAPVASSLQGRRMKQSGIFAPVRMPTWDLMETVELGTVNRTVVYNQLLAPQELPAGTRGKIMSRLFAKYRCLKATIRVESAVPTSSGGQYGVFFDPNPANDWTTNDGSAVAALTSMPVQGIAAAWECMELPIPPSQLNRDAELYTEDATSERLVTRLGQIVLINLATPTVVPAGSAEVTVWFDAEWEFYEPNASSEDNSVTTFVAGTWSIGTTKAISYPTSTPTTQYYTVYRLFPALPATMFDGSGDVEYVAYHESNNMLGFRSLEDAIGYAKDDVFTNAVGPSASPTSVQPATVGITLARFKPTTSTITSLTKYVKQLNLN